MRRGELGQVAHINGGCHEILDSKENSVTGSFGDHRCHRPSGRLSDTLSLYPSSPSGAIGVLSSESRSGGQKTSTKDDLRR